MILKLKSMSDIIDQFQKIIIKGIYTYHHMSVLQSFENTYGGKRAKKNKVGVNVGNVKCSLS